MSPLKVFKEISAMVFDIDGVLTNGMIYLQNDFKIIRSMNIKDGYALQLAIKKNYKIAIISGGNAENVKARLNILGVKDIYLKTENKKEVLVSWSKKENVSLQNVLYMGDDMPDLETIKVVGLGACPWDAADQIKANAKYISNFKGGEGCVRDVIEKILKLNDDWE